MPVSDAGDYPAACDGLQGHDSARFMHHRSARGVPVEPNFAGETTRVADLDRRIIARAKYDLMSSGVTPAVTYSG
jgi:hypothetical protein